MPLTRHGFATLDVDTCFSLLSTKRLGRLGLTMGGLPVILPVSFVVDGHSVIFRSVPGSKLHAMARGDVVCFEVDDADYERWIGWSVLVTGRAYEITDPEELRRVEDMAIDPWPVLDADRYIRLEGELVTGRWIENDGNDTSGDDPA